MSQPAGWTAADVGEERYYQARAEMFAHNRRITDEREIWPPGVLAECERLDAVHPGWAVTWMWGRFYPRPYPNRYAAMMPERTAYLVSGLGWRRPWVYGETVAELEEQIAIVDGQIAAAIRARDAEWMRR